MNDQTNPTPMMDISQQQPVQDLEQQMPQDHEHKGKALTYGILVVLVLACSVAWFYLYKKPQVMQKEVTPLQTLSMLKDISQHDDSTNTEKVKTLTELRTGTSPAVSVNEALQALDILNK